MDLKQVKTEHGVLRKRGRPAGKNRVPLSNVERRARNAQYESERRTEMADALTALAKAADCESSITNQDLLVTVAAQLRRTARRKPGRDADSLRRCNESFKSQIAALEQQLNLDLDGSKKFSSSSHGEQTEELHRLETACSQLSEYSSPERKYSPSLAFSSGQEALAEELPGLNRVSEPERDFTPGCQGLNSPKRKLSFEEYHPPPGNQFSSEHRQLELSSYQFADEQVPTPEYRITSESPDSIVPEPQHFLCQEVSPSQPELPSLTVVSEPHYHDPYLSQPLLITRAPSPTRHQNDTMAGLHVRNAFISPGFNEGSSTADFDRRIHFLSTEDLISVYLPS